MAGKLFVPGLWKRVDQRRQVYFFLSYLAHQPDAISFTSSDLKPMLAAAGFKTILDEVMIPEITKMLVAQKPE